MKGTLLSRAGSIVWTGSRWETPGRERTRLRVARSATTSNPLNTMRYSWRIWTPAARRLAFTVAWEILREETKAFWPAPSRASRQSAILAACSAASELPWTETTISTGAFELMLKEPNAWDKPATSVIGCMRSGKLFDSCDQLRADVPAITVATACTGTTPIDATITKANTNAGIRRTILASLCSCIDSILFPSEDDPSPLGNQTLFHASNSHSLILRRRNEIPPPRPGRPYAREPEDQSQIRERDSVGRPWTSPGSNDSASSSCPSSSRRRSSR